MSMHKDCMSAMRLLTEATTLPAACLQPGTELSRGMPTPLGVQEGQINENLCCAPLLQVEQYLVKAEEVHEDFRLWITAEPHPSFPIGLLQMGIKITNEAPVGMKAGLRASYQWVTQVRGHCGTLLLACPVGACLGVLPPLPGTPGAAFRTLYGHAYSMRRSGLLHHFWLLVLSTRWCRSE